MKRMYLIVLVFVLAIGLPQTVLAHAELVSSTPENGATLDAVPKTITLLFSEELTDQSAFTVVDAAGETVGEGSVDLDDLDRKTMRGKLSSETGNGVYTVRWVAYSAEDTHGEEGSISFTLALAQPTVELTAATNAPTVELAATPTVAPTVEPTAALQATAVPEPTVLFIDSPTNPGGPTAVNDDGARIGRMIALIVVLITVVGVTAAVVLTRRRGEEQ